jgi:hypothetical protein
MANGVVVMVIPKLRDFCSLFVCNLEETAKMGKDAAAVRREFQARLGQMARELGGELYPDGLPRGTPFSELEGIAGALGDEIARQLIESQVGRQAEDWPEEELGECPLCGGPAGKAPDEPRVLETTRGDVAWKERVANCPRCRRAFFPSEPSLGA